MAKIEIGSKAPDIQLADDNGDTVALGEMNGKQVVIYFYPKDDTPGCTKEAIAFSALKSDFDALNTVIWGLSPDNVAKHGKFKAKHNLSVTLLADEDKKAAEAYGVWVEKSMYGKQYMGVERSTILVSADGKIAKIWRKVKVPGHAQEVLAEAKALHGAG